MAVLADQDRADCCADYQRDPLMGPIGVTKPDLRAALNALDDFLNTNAATINSAIPLPARTSLTTAQKAMLLMYVVQKRYIKGA